MDNAGIGNGAEIMEGSKLVKHKSLCIPLACFLLFTFACSSSPGRTVTATPGVPVTYTPSLTDSPAPTATLQPSATSTPRPTLTPLASDLGQVVFSESFDDLNMPFDVCGTSRIESGVLIVERETEAGSPCGIFAGGIYARDPLPPNTTLIILFKTTHDFNVGIDAGTYGDETLRRFTFSLAQGTAAGI
jgi:hypothetical protein